MGHMPKSKRPWMKYFPTDAVSDVALRQCSRASRSAWHDLYLVMHFSDPRGYLIGRDGKSLSYTQLSKLLGEPEKETRQYMQELENNGVFSRTELPHELGSGVIYCRRMVREEEQEALDRANGKKGGNPALISAHEFNLERSTRLEERRINDRERSRRYRARKKARDV